MIEQLGRWLRRRQGIERNPIYRLSCDVIAGRLQLERAYQMVEEPRVLGRLADGDLWELDREAARAALDHPDHALILTRLAILAARYKGFDRILVDFNLRAADLVAENENTKDQELHLREAMHAAERIANTQGQRRALSRLARLAIEREDSERAGELLHRQLEIGREETDTPEDIETALLLGDMSRTDGDMSSAFDYYQRAGQSARRIGHFAGVVDSLLRQLVLHRERNDEDAAFLVLQQAQEAAEKTMDARLQAEIAIQTGAMLAERGQYQQSRDQLVQALERTRAINDITMETRCLTGLATIELNAGDTINATQHFRELADLERSLGNRTATVRSLLQAAELLMDQGELDQASSVVIDAEHMAEGINNPGLQQQAAGIRGLIYVARGQYQESMDRLMSATRYAQDAGDVEAEARWLAGIGEALIQFGEISDAEYAAERCLELAKETPNPRLEATGLALQGSIHIARGRWREADESLRRAHLLARNAGDKKNQIRYLELLSSIANELRQPDSALKYLQQASDAASQSGPDTRAKLHGRLARWYQSREEYKPALKQYQQAYEAAEECQSDTMMARALRGMATIQDITGDEEAPDSYREAIKATERARDWNNLLALHYNLGALLYDAGNDGEAGYHLNRATELGMQVGDYRVADAARELLQWVQPSSDEYDAPTRTAEDTVLGEIAIREELSRLRDSHRS